jgi:hypothetical protein
MFRIKRKHLYAILLVAAVIVGLALGYEQDELTRNIATSALPLYVIGLVGWMGYVLWSVAALRVPALQWRGIPAPAMPLVVIAISWVATMLGSMIYYLSSEKDIRSLWAMLALSTFAGTAYHFGVFVLPIILFRIGSAITSRAFTSRPTE